MRGFRPALLAGILGFWCAGAMADATAALSDLLSELKSFQGNFSQLMLDSRGTRLQQTEGQIKAQRPGHFYWHTGEPFEQWVISDGKQVTIYDPDLEQVTIQAVDQRISHTPALLLSGEVSQLRERYLVEEYRESGALDKAGQTGKPPAEPRLRRFRLEPLNPDSVFEELWLVFENEQLIEMDVKDSLGQKTRIRFSDVTYNQAIPKQVFEFDPPKGVDVISEF